MFVTCEVTTTLKLVHANSEQVMMAEAAYLPSSNIRFSSTMPEFPIRKAKWVLIRSDFSPQLLVSTAKWMLLLANPIMDIDILQCVS